MPKAAVAFLAVALSAFGARADSYYWDMGGGADTNWTTPANWSSDIKPGPADQACFLNIGGAWQTQTVTLNSTESVGGFLSNSTSAAFNWAGAGTLNVAGGALLFFVFRRERSPRIAVRHG